MGPNIKLKGLRQGILISIGDADSWEEALPTLLGHIDQQREFLRGARVAIDLGNHVLKAVDMGKLRDALSERELYLFAILSNSPKTEETAQMLGLDTTIDRPSAGHYQKESTAHLQGGEDAMLLNRTIRSGLRIQFPGHVIVLGDVNPGGEIIAGGNVIIWGRLQGMVHAGAGGDEEAIVCALDLQPTQLRISDQIAVTPPRRGKPQPEFASLKDGKVVSDVWNPKKKK